jgi:hypothetical protein
VIGFLTGALLLLLTQSSAALGVPVEPIETNLDFKVFINDREVGSHNFRLFEQGENLQVSSTMHLDFKVLLIKKIKYHHQAEEVWQGGCLVSLKSQTLKQGKTFTVNASSSSEGLLVANAEGSRTIDGCARGFAYWNPRFLEADFLLNAESGEYLPVEISTSLSEQNNITHMLIAGPQADVRLQYDAAGNWLSLESELQIGGLIRYQRVMHNLAPHTGQ